MTTASDFTNLKVEKDAFALSQDIPFWNVQYEK